MSNFPSLDAGSVGTHPDVTELKQNVSQLQQQTGALQTKAQALETYDGVLRADLDQKISGIKVTGHDGLQFNDVNRLVFDGSDMTLDPDGMTVRVIPLGKANTPTFDPSMFAAAVDHGYAADDQGIKSSRTTSGWWIFKDLPTVGSRPSDSAGELIVFRNEVDTTNVEMKHAFIMAIGKTKSQDNKVWFMYRDGTTWSPWFSEQGADQSAIDNLVASVDALKAGDQTIIDEVSKLKSEVGNLYAPTKEVFDKDVNTLIQAALKDYKPINGGTSLTVGEQWGDYKTVDNTTDINTLYPIEVGHGMDGPNQPATGVAVLSIDPDAYEPQHSKTCMVKLDASKMIPNGRIQPIYMDEEIVPMGIWYSFNQAERGINVQDNTGGDINVTGGQLTEVLASISMFGNAQVDGIVRVWAEYKDARNPVPSNILRDVNGNLMAVQKHYKQGQPLGDIILSGGFMALTTEPFKIMMEASFASNELVTLNPDRTLLCFNQFGDGYETSIARIEFQRRLNIQLTPAIQHFKSEMLKLSDEINGMTFAEAVMEPFEAESTLNQVGITNLTRLKGSVANGLLTLKDDGVNIPDFYVNMHIDNTQTQMLRGKTIVALASLVNRDNAFDLEAYGWNGKPNQQTPVYESRNNGSIVLNSNWGLIESVFVPESPNGAPSSPSIKFTVPDTSNNIAIIVRPHDASLPTTLEMTEFMWGTEKDFSGYTEVSYTKLDQEYLKFNEGYAEFVYPNSGYVSVRYTINDTIEGNPMPVGWLLKGKAPVKINNTLNTVAGSGTPQFDGVLEFTADGEVNVSKTYRVCNETNTDNEVTFWDVLFDVSGTPTVIAGSEQTFTIKANTPYPGVLFTTTAYSVDVLAGQSIGGRAASSKNDGAFVQTAGGKDYLVQTVIDFKELTVVADEDELISAPLTRYLNVDRRSYEFTANEDAFVVIPVDIPDDVKLVRHSVVSSTTGRFSSVDGTRFRYDTVGKKITISGLLDITDGVVFLEFWA